MGWSLDGKEIRREFQFEDFNEAMRFVNHVADLAEGAVHHPDITVNYNKVKLSLTTHDAGGLTERDFSLAKQVDHL